MIVTVGNTKGGTGKTTFAVQIALERQAAGRAVLFIDADRQGSAQKVMTMRAESGHRPLACVQLADGRLLRAQLAPLAEQHDDTVIDAGGHDSEALRSDLLVVPVQPRALNAWELEVMAGTDAVARRRKAVANAMANGLAIPEWRPLDQQAWDEIKLWGVHLTGVRDRAPRAGGIRALSNGARGCGSRTSVMAGTIFDWTRTPLTVRFSVCWHFASGKDGHGDVPLPPVSLNSG